MVLAGISLGAHTDQHAFNGGTLTSVGYRDEIFDPYVQPYAGAIGPNFIRTDNNAQPPQSAIVEDYHEGRGLVRMERPALFPDQNLIEHLWDYLDGQVDNLNPPPWSLYGLD